MSLAVRPATLADLPLLVGFQQAMAEETEGRHLPAGILEAGIRYLLTHPEEGQFLVAERAGSVAGGLMLTYEWSDWRNGRFWWIQDVYVQPEQRGSGVYRALHEAVRGLARASGTACGIRLYVEKDNVTAQLAYQHLGMRETDYRLFEELLD